MNYGRHILFWIVYCCYFFLQSIAPWSTEEIFNTATYRNAFISMYCFIPVCVLCVYVSIYFILPRYIELRKYPAAILMFTALFSAGAFINYFSAQVYFAHSGVTGTGKGPFLLGYLNTIWAMIIGGFAICLKVTLNWFTQQKEIELITQQKARSELNLQKFKIHPAFLYSSLDSIYADLKANKSSSSSMILVLSNLLSYSLYDSKADHVTLQAELNAVNDFISLQRMKGAHAIILYLDPAINTDVVMVPPMILLSVVQERRAKEISLRQDDHEVIVTIVFADAHHSVITLKSPVEEMYEPA